MRAADRRAEQACEWLAGMPGGRATPGEVGAALALNHARQAETVKAMRANGWAEGGQTLALTAEGWARFGSPVVSAEGAGEVLERALEGWPQTHRAFVELAASAVVARHHLGAVQPSGHLGFMALGETGTGKSAAAGLLCDVFGWDPAEHVLLTPAETAGSLLGRRVQAEGGVRWEAAAVTRLPFVFLDELDKADEAAARRAMVFMQGERRLRFEDQVHELLPVAMLAANPPRGGRDRYADLRQEYRRRAVVLDTAGMRARGHELARLLRAYYADPRRPRLSLEALRPPESLPDSARAILDSMTNVLTDAGREEFEMRSLEFATLGRMALLGADADADVAALLTACGYLQVSETQPGMVRQGWQQSLGPVRQSLGTRASAAQLLAMLERGEVERAERARAVRQARTQQASAGLEVAEQGATLAARLGRMHEALDGRRLQALTAGQRDEAKGLRRTLRTLQGKAARVSTARGLEEVQALAEDPLRRAEALVAAETAERTRKDRETVQAAAEAAQQAAWAKQQREAERAAVKQARAFQREQLAAQEREARELLAQVVAEAKPLEQLYRRTRTAEGESPLAQLRRLQVDGRAVLAYQGNQGSGLLSALGAAFTGEVGRWMIAGTSQGFPGSPSRCAALAEWGPGTRAVLAPVLRYLHGQEDVLVQRLGKQPRAGRPNCSAAGPARQIRPAAAGVYGALPVSRR